MTTKEMRDFVNKYMARLTKFNALLDREGHKTRLFFNIGGGSYTDGQNVTVGLFEFMNEAHPMYKLYKEIIGEADEEDLAKVICKGLNVHEQGHCYFSNFSVLQSYATWFGKNFYSGTDTRERKIVEQLGAKLSNACEDGRIEAFMINKYPGAYKPVQTVGLTLYKLDNEIHDKLSSFMMSICYYSKFGLLPIYWDEIDDETKDAVKTLKPYLNEFVKTASSVKAFKTLKSGLLAIKPYLEKLIKELLEQEKVNQMIAEMLQKILEEHPEYTSSNPVDSDDLEGNPIQMRNPSGSGQGSPSNSKSSSGQSSGSGEEGDQKNEDGSGSGSEGEDGEDKKDGKGSGSGKEGKEDKDKKDGEGSGSDSDSKKKEEEKEGQGKDGKSGEEDGKDGKENGEGEGKDSSNKKKHQKGNRDLSKAERGGNESRQGKDEAANEDNNGQGTSDGILRKGSGEDVKTDNQLQQEIQDIINDAIEDSNDADKRAAKKEQRDRNAKGDFEITPEAIQSIKKSYARYSYEYESKDVDVDVKLPEDIAKEGRILRRAIEKVFKSKVAENITGQRRGKISKGKLYKTAAYDYSVFERRSDPYKPDIAMAIVWDGSGSMCGMKQAHSTKACAVIEEATKGLIPLRIINFTTNAGVTHYQVKKFSDTRKDKNYAYSYGSSRRFGGGNKDGYSIKVTTAELEQRSERDKIMIILSDGLPSDYSSTNEAVNDVREAVVNARKKGIKVISIFFGDQNFLDSEIDNYKFMYDTGIIATTPDKIVDELATQLKKAVTRK